MGSQLIERYQDVADENTGIALTIYYDGRREKKFGVFRYEMDAADNHGGALTRKRRLEYTALSFFPTAAGGTLIGAATLGLFATAIGLGFLAFGTIISAGIIWSGEIRSRAIGVEYDDSNNWEFGFNNKFARNLKKQLATEFRAAPSSKTPIHVCKRCKGMLFGERLGFPADQLTLWRTCQLCDLIFDAVRRPNKLGQEGVIKRIGSTIILEQRSRPLQVPILRLCSDIWSSEKSDIETQISFPVLPQSKEFRFALLRQWLEWCDQTHNCRHIQNKEMPPRLIDVGTSSTNTPKLVLKGAIKPSKYIAVSHRWGLTPAERRMYSTTRENYESHQTGIKQLAPTFKDAIEVARALGVQYLWVDSLCIIQNDPEDWEEQANLMKTTYTSAYCTIATTSAQNMNDTFLEPMNRRNENICIKNGTNQPIYACSDIGTFDEEVDNTEFNRRAWILQERLLACRTIHFGAGQMYWECGKGVYCEDLTQLRASRGQTRHFRLDPQFPSLLYRSGVAETWNFLQSLLQDYSNRGISKSEDRAIAISGLQERISSALHCEGRHGVFGFYLHRNLLWQRSDQKLKRINYNTRKVPSWSWMAYEGSIEFPDITFNQFMFFDSLQFDPMDKAALITSVWSFKDSSSVADATPADVHQVVDVSGKERGLILYDEGREASSQPLCIIVGRSCQPPGFTMRKHLAKIPPRRDSNFSRYYIVAVKEMQEAKGTYERIGVGWIRNYYVLSEVKSKAKVV